MPAVSVAPGVLQVVIREIEVADPRGGVPVERQGRVAPDIPPESTVSICHARADAVPGTGTSSRDARTSRPTIARFMSACLPIIREKGEHARAWQEAPVTVPCRPGGDHHPGMDRRRRGRQPRDRDPVASAWTPEAARFPDGGAGKRGPAFLISLHRVLARPPPLSIWVPSTRTYPSWFGIPATGWCFPRSAAQTP